MLETGVSYIACDEAGHTGPDLLDNDQRHFAFASVKISDEEAWSVIQDARSTYPVQMAELKASRLMKSRQGQRLISKIIDSVSDRIAVNYINKLLGLCGWVFEYIFEPVYQEDPFVFYEEEFHQFIAMYCYLWFLDENSNADTTLKEFQKMMRSRRTEDAPSLFKYENSVASNQNHPFELIKRFATAHADKIEKEISELQQELPDAGKWAIDLSASGLWSHLNHWGTLGEPLQVLCDSSKPIAAMVDSLSGLSSDPAIVRAKLLKPDEPLGWEFAEPVRLVDSRAHPSVQIADVIASATVHCFSHGVPDGFGASAKIIEGCMLNDSIHPNFERVKLDRDPVKLHYLVLSELAERAEGRGSELPIRQFFEVSKRVIAEGRLST